MAPPPLEDADVPATWLGPVYDDAPIWPNTDWWINFNDAELSAFIDEVKANNFDLANNRRNLEAAQIALREAGLARWPNPVVEIGDGLNAQRHRLGHPRDACRHVLWPGGNVHEAGTTAQRRSASEQRRPGHAAVAAD